MRELDLQLHPRVPPLIRALPHVEYLSLFRAEESQEESDMRDALGVATADDLHPAPPLQTDVVMQPPPVVPSPPPVFPVSTQSRLPTVTDSATTSLPMLQAAQTQALPTNIQLQDVAQNAPPPAELATPLTPSAGPFTAVPGSALIERPTASTDNALASSIAPKVSVAPVVAEEDDDEPMPSIDMDSDSDSDQTAM